MILAGTCPVCGSRNEKTLSGPRGASRYHRCRSCGHAWLFPVPSANELASYYNSVYAVPEAAHFETAEREFPIVSAAIGQHPASGKMLEIGCSYGAMLAKFAAAGWVVEGVELDTRAVQAARTRPGMRVHHGGLEETLDSLSPPYDVIAAYHVVEHLPDPVRFLEQVRTLCAQNGILVLRLPNGSSIGARAASGWWEWFLIPEHIHIFSTRSISLLLERTGFAVRSSTSRRGDANTLLFEMVSAAGKIAWHAGRRAGEDPTRRHGFRPSETKLYFTIRSALNAMGAPLDLVTGFANRFGLRPLPELMLTANPATPKRSR